MLFEKIDEDPVAVTTTSTSLTQATNRNVSVLNENILEIVSENQILKVELISSR